jgi:hypothetical protein
MSEAKSLPLATVFQPDLGMIIISEQSAEATRRDQSALVDTYGYVTAA